LSASSRQQLVEQTQSQPAEKETKLSRTYPQSGYMVRDGKPKASFISITAR
jgi:hypothetical protein